MDQTTDEDRPEPTPYPYELVPGYTLIGVIGACLVLALLAAATVAALLARFGS